MTKLILIILVLLALPSCAEPYREHVSSRSYTFHTSSGRSVSFEHELMIAPDRKILDRLITKIDHAEKRIWVETYIWTEKTLRDAVLRAHDRGVDIRVLLEGNVYNTPRINDDMIDALRLSGATARFTSDRYTFTHMKLVIIDDEWCVSTGNWTYTSFTKNRELTLCSKDQSMASNLETIFLADERYIRPVFPLGIDRRIGLAPENMRSFLEQHIQGAKKEIYIYNQTLSDDGIKKILKDRKTQGIQIFLCTAKKKEESSEGETQTDMLIDVSLGPYLHAKALVIDDRDVLIGSANLTENAIDRNREVMIFLSGALDTAKKIKDLYNSDCKRQE